LHALPSSAGTLEQVPLRGPTGLLLTIGPEPTATVGPAGVPQLSPSVVQIAWEPEDRRQCEVEIRARLMGCNCLIGQRPIVRFRVELGHAEQVWTEPPAPFGQVAGAPLQEHSLPARGAIWRLNVRELRLQFRNAGVIGGGPGWSRGELQVSIQPCVGQHVPTLPWSSYVVPVVPSSPHLLPLEAREWKLMDVRGLPLAAGAVGIVLVGPAGALLAALDGALLFDWTPIPHEASGWTTDAPHWVAFR
jgi:hypothetical protein